MGMRMVSENIENFNIQALRAMAALYRTFPGTMDLDDNVFLKPTAQNDDGVVVEMPTQSGYGTLLWLSRNDFVEGQLVESHPIGTDRPSVVITGAQLSSRALRILLREEEFTRGVPLGEYVVAAAFSGTESVAAAWLAKRLIEA
jgi:hypothetical protein